MCKTVCIGRGVVIGTRVKGAVLGDGGWLNERGGVVVGGSGRCEGALMVDTQEECSVGLGGSIGGIRAGGSSGWRRGDSGQSQLVSSGQLWAE